MGKWDKDTKEKISYGIAITSFLVGVILIFISLFLEPVGEIHASVLGATGTFLSFSGALLGISLHYNSELQNFKSQVISKLKTEEKEKENETISG